jgi:hypothetical protein
MRYVNKFLTNEKQMGGFRAKKAKYQATTENSN